MVLRKLSGKTHNSITLTFLLLAASYNPPHSQAGARNAVDTIDKTDDEGSLCDPSTSSTPTVNYLSIYDTPKDLCVVCYFFFDEQSLSLGQVDG